MIILYTHYKHCHHSSPCWRKIYCICSIFIIIINFLRKSKDLRASLRSIAEPDEPMPISPKFRFSPKWWCQPFHIFWRHINGKWDELTILNALTKVVIIIMKCHLSCSTFPHLSHNFPSPLYYMGVKHFLWTENEMNQLSWMLWLKLDNIFAEIVLSLYLSLSRPYLAVTSI